MAWTTPRMWRDLRAAVDELNEAGRRAGTVRLPLFSDIELGRMPQEMVKDAAILIAGGVDPAAVRSALLRKLEEREAERKDLGGAMVLRDVYSPETFDELSRDWEVLGLPVVMDPEPVAVARPAVEDADGSRAIDLG